MNIGISFSGAETVMFVPSLAESKIDPTTIPWIEKKEKNKKMQNNV